MADEEDTTMIFDPSQKKKKKKTKKTAFDLDAALAGESQPKVESAEGKEDDGEQSLDMTEVKEALPASPTEDAEFDFGSKKKKAKKVKISDLAPGEDPISEKIQEGEYTKTDADYTYEQLLTRVFDIMRQVNPDMESGERKKFIMKPPQLARVGTKKTAFTNFGEVCKLLKRQPKHLVQFLLAELGTSGNVDANSTLILKGRYHQKHLETVLRRYIKEYVTCHTCRSPDTILERETRLFFLKCSNCHSRSSVTSIKQGYQAVTGKRAALRAKAGV